MKFRYRVLVHDGRDSSYIKSKYIDFVYPPNVEGSDKVLMSSYLRLLKNIRDGCPHQFLRTLIGMVRTL